MSTKREKFIMLAENRVEKLVKQIELIGNLSNKNAYDFSEDDVLKIFARLEADLKIAKNRFRFASVKSSEKKFTI
jgi:hypothetical protein